MPHALARCLTPLLLAAALAAQAKPLLTDGFEQQGKWKKNIQGKGAVELADGGVTGKCLKVTSAERALAYYSIELDAKQVRGKRLVIRAQVKLDNVAVGPEMYSTAKLHVGIRAGKRADNRAQRFVGTRDWHPQVLIAPIPDDAERVTLDLGIQNGTGTAWFDDLVVDDGVKDHTAVSIKPAANANYRTAPVDLGGIPVADVKLAGVDFDVMDGEENFGRTCIALRGAAHPDLPARIETVCPVDAKASRLLFLLAAVGVDPRRKAISLVCDVRYADGRSATIEMREGVDIGDITAPKDLPNWKVGWTAREGGKTLGLGVAAWTNPRPGVAIKWLRMRTPGDGAAAIVVAISLDPEGT